MPIKTKEVKTYINKLYCDNCIDEVEMLSTNSILLTNPPQYTYFCPRCNHTITLTTVYPSITYK